MSWLPITDYSAKHKVSISTLRRRIKANEINFRFDDGKYFIMDEPVLTNQKAHRPSQGISDPSVLVANIGNNIKDDFVETTTTSLPQQNQVLYGPDVVQALLSELKKAYAGILAEKEEQILQLKEEVTDLKTLARILEEELEKKTHSSLGY